MLDERLRIWELILLIAEIGGERGEERKREKKKNGGSGTKFNRQLMGTASNEQKMARKTIQISE